MRWNRFFQFPYPNRIISPHVGIASAVPTFFWENISRERYALGRRIWQAVFPWPGARISTWSTAKPATAPWLCPCSSSTSAPIQPYSWSNCAMPLKPPATKLRSALFPPRHCQLHIHPTATITNQITPQGDKPALGILVSLISIPPQKLLAKTNSKNKKFFQKSNPFCRLASIK